MYERLKAMAAGLTGQDQNRRLAHQLYVETADASRRPGFYSALGVPDTVEGRYDLLSVHMILLLRRLRQGDERDAAFAQLVFDIMFRDVDDNLREMGVGDMRIGKKVRGYAEAFFGRAKVYDEGLKGQADLADALARNVYGEPVVTEHARRLAEYVRGLETELAEQDIGTLRRGRVRFPAVPTQDEKEVTDATAQ
jgi:cytochrome b pre-mRNA-processing protein 3